MVGGKASRECFHVVCALYQYGQAMTISSAVLV